jgi:hypothetical protein
LFEYIYFRKNIFENQAAGATADATKVLVIITDGNPSDTDKRFNSIERSDKKNIIRFVIGVSPIISIIPPTQHHTIV